MSGLSSLGLSLKELQMPMKDSLSVQSEKRAPAQIAHKGICVATLAALNKNSSGVVEVPNTLVRGINARGLSLRERGMYQAMKERMFKPWQAFEI